MQELTSIEIDEVSGSGPVVVGAVVVAIVVIAIFCVGMAAGFKDENKKKA